jgi:hypothetical protein
MRDEAEMLQRFADEESKALVSYWIFGTMSSIDNFFQWVGSAPGSGGRKKSPQALMAWRAKAGDNFFLIFLWFVSFHRLGKKWTSTFKGNPPAINSK